MLTKKISNLERQQLLDDIFKEYDEALQVLKDHWQVRVLQKTTQHVSDMYVIELTDTKLELTVTGRGNTYNHALKSALEQLKRRNRI